MSIEEQLDSGKIPVIVPTGFEEHAVSENIYCSNAMMRRASYQYGDSLEISETGKLSMGIGLGQSTGTVTYMSPTYEITEALTTLTIDGVELDFQLTPGTEAPAEMNTWIPEKKALWVAEVTNTIVYADPENEAARLLCADALEQLAYQAESGIWRNSYLSAAKELRTGEVQVNGLNAASDLLMSMSVPQLFDYLGIILDKDELADKEFKINIDLTDTKEKYMLHFNNGALLKYKNTQSENADVTLTCAKKALFYLMSENYENAEKVINIKGDKELLKTFMENLDELSEEELKAFNIIEP